MSYTRKLKEWVMPSHMMKNYRVKITEDFKERTLKYAQEDAAATARLFDLISRTVRALMQEIHIRDKRKGYSLMLSTGSGVPTSSHRYTTLCGQAVLHEELSHHQADHDNQEDIMDSEEPTCMGCIMMQLDPEVRQVHE